MSQLIGICWDCDNWWFEVYRLGERCPEDGGEEDEHNITYYREVDSVDDIKLQLDVMDDDELTEELESSSDGQWGRALQEERDRREREKWASEVAASERER